MVDRRDLDTVVLKALRKVPRERYTSVFALSAVRDLLALDWVDHETHTFFEGLRQLHRKIREEADSRFRTAISDYLQIGDRMISMTRTNSAAAVKAALASGPMKLTDVKRRSVPSACASANCRRTPTMIASSSASRASACWW